MRAVHPFPARMAPELVEAQLDELPSDRVLLDPMMGSGTFVLGAASRGHAAIGVDSDPLARIITAAAAGSYDKAEVLAYAKNIVGYARSQVGACEVTTDSETQEFIDFWFDPVARDELSALAMLIDQAPQELLAPLWCGFSRLIITKDSGASRARDVSHSRPHRVRETASISPLDQYYAAVVTVVQRAYNRLPGRLTLITGDARKLPLDDECVDGIMTSPPYLIAIDYLRGHRLSLVWMGHTVSELRGLRGTNVGTERGSELPPSLQSIFDAAVTGDTYPRKRKILNTYVKDIDAVLTEQSRVMRVGGSLTHVVANAQYGASGVSVEAIVALCAARHGLRSTGRFERRLAQRKRYLPPPRQGTSALDRRMHTEVILSFSKS